MLKEWRCPACGQGIRVAQLPCGPDAPGLLLAAAMVGDVLAR